VYDQLPLIDLHKRTFTKSLLQGQIMPPEELDQHRIFNISSVNLQKFAWRAYDQVAHHKIAVLGYDDSTLQIR
jgi:hypothetical protein